MIGKIQDCRWAEVTIAPQVWSQVSSKEDGPSDLEVSSDKVC